MSAECRAFEPGLFSSWQLYGQRGNYLFCHFILKSKDIPEVPAVSFGPDMIACCGVKQLRGNAQLIASFTDTAFEQIADA